MADFSTIARPYAKALFDIASVAGTLAEWSAALSAAADVVGDDEARSFLARPDLLAKQRAQFLQSVCSSMDDAEALASAEGRNLLRLLAENDRLTALAEISAQFDGLKTQAENKIKVTLVSASEVNSESAEKIQQTLQQRLGRAVELSLEVDAALLGGAIVRAEDMVIDGSVKSRLQRLAETLVD